MKADLLVRRLGGHPASELGLDLDAGDDRSLGRWLVAAILLGVRGPEERSVGAWRALAACDLADPPRIARCDAGQLVAALSELPKPEQTAAVLRRVSAALEERYGGQLTKLAGEAEGLEDLGGRLARLAPGFGGASVARLLRPLRDLWPMADELPLSAQAAAAVAHLGWAPEEACSSATLRSALEACVAPPALRDLEAALTRLGATCRARRPERCPLGPECPAR